MGVVAYVCLLIWFIAITAILANDEVDRFAAKAVMFVLIAIPTIYYGVDLFIN